MNFLHSSPRDGSARTVYVRIWATRRAAGSLRAAMARLAAARARTNTLRMLPDTLYFEMQPALSLHVSSAKFLFINEVFSVNAIFCGFKKPSQLSYQKTKRI